MKHDRAAVGIPSASRREFLLNGAVGAAALAVQPLYALGLAANPSTVVTTPAGKLRGELAGGVRVFRGVRFAEPPVGDLRFRPPVAAKPWQGTRDALAFAPAPLQEVSDDLRTSEDCLFLNVWAPPGKGPFPVFVWIYGGGFTAGNTSTPLFDGTQFAREGILVVTVAYRLGVFGFMDLSPLLGPAYADSGNNAMRDLVCSLEWVHANISAFGGDPARVTVGGESAGAKATAAMMAIPRAAALFQSAISESGGGERVLTEAQATQISNQFGDLWRAAHPAASPGFDDLRNASGADLLATQKALIAAATLHFPFRSQVGGSLLPRRPVDLVAAQSSAGKRLLIGTNRDESAAFLGAHPKADPLSRDLGNLDLTRFDAVFANYPALYPEMTEAQRRIRAVTAEEYWVPSIRLADAQVAGGGEAWMYRLDYSKQTGPMAGEASHGLDLGLLWEKLDAVEREDPLAEPLSREMHLAWIAFVQGRAPAAPNLPAWQAYNPQTRPTMILGPDPRIEQNPQDGELRLWDGVL